MKLSVIGGLAAMVLPIAAQARSGGTSVGVDVTAAHVYQTDWRHGWRRHYEPPVYYSPPVTVYPPSSSYYYEEPQPYYAPDYVPPDCVPPIVVEPDDGYYGYYDGYRGGHYHHDRDRGRWHGGEHGWHRR